jgi:radical SAM-linked protein
LRYKVAIRFAVQDDVRFISHHDMMRLFERALARTQLPVRFSEGFNPRPKLSLPLPRPVGIASTVDVLVVEFIGPTDPQEALRQLAAQMPGGVTLAEAWIPLGQRPMQPESATYSLELPADQVSLVGEQVGVLLQASNWPIRRSDSESGPGKELDLRSYLLHADIEGHRLSWTVRITGGGTIRPPEFLAAIGLDPAHWHHRVCRTAIAWQPQAPAGPEPHSPADE